LGVAVLIFHSRRERRSTSEAARQLFEPSNEDRLEVVGLLLQPSEFLSEIRKSLVEGLTLSHVSWALIA
jgi:hypothetical protein